MEVAALFVAAGGVYFDPELAGIVDPWDEARDARKYAGPHPVVAHPPCERWGRYWYGGPSVKVRKTKGDDGGCFASALASVRKYGGVLEHPEASAAWGAHGLMPPVTGGWHYDLVDGSWCCEVAQSAYGHRARKLTWLYYVGDAPPPSLDWSRRSGVRLEEGFHSTAARAAARAAGVRPVERLGHRERAATPIPFRDVLIEMARSVA